MFFPPRNSLAHHTWRIQCGTNASYTPATQDLSPTCQKILALISIYDTPLLETHVGTNNVSGWF